MALGLTEEELRETEKTLDTYQLHQWVSMEGRGVQDPGAVDTPSS